MRPLDLDFQPRRFPAAGLGLLALGLLALAAVATDYRRTAAAMDFWQAELARLQQPRERALPRTGDDRQLQQVVQAARAVAKDIQRPWDALFATLEAAKTDDIALLTLNPDAGKGVVRITGEARQREAILGFIERLGQGGVLRNVFLVEDQLQEQDPEKPFRFLISADWVGAA